MRIVPVLLAVFALTPPLGASSDALERVRDAERGRIEVMAGTARGVVCIFDENRGSGGSGVIITPEGVGVTNYHVVAPLMETRRGLGGMADGKIYPLEVLGLDPTGDVAMFRVTGRDGFDPVALGDADTVRVGDWVYAQGNPFMLAEDYAPTVTYGIVSGVHRYQYGADGRSLVYTDCIQVDASINPGNSGGPLFDMGGRLIGINGRASFERRGRVNVGLGYAITINQIERFIPGLRAGLLVEHGSLGATTIDLGYRRVVFEKMLEPSVASAAGIDVGDRLVAFAGEPIRSSNQFASLLGVYPAGWPVEVVFEHDGAAVSRRIRLERLPVPLDAPFEVDADLNRAETRRVLDPCRQWLGGLPLAGKLSWRSRVERVKNAAADPERLAVEVMEAPEGTCVRRVLDALGQVVSTEEYDGRTAFVRPKPDQTIDASPTQADRLNVWLAARRALYGPLEEADIERWRHVGGDGYEGRVIDVLEFHPDEGRDLLVGIDPQTHAPVRVRFEPDDAPSPDRPAVEVELGDYRSVGGTLLPHRLTVHVGGEVTEVETVLSYERETAP